jgi:hypothetical protein
MDQLPFDHLPYFDRVKIQTEILLPLFRRMRDELGNERACEMLRGAVAEYAMAFGQSIRASDGDSSLDKLQKAIPVFAGGDALEVEIIAYTKEELTFNVVKCKYAEFFHDLGEPEFGAILTCAVDPGLTKAFGQNLEFERSQTRMGNASHCDFSWKEK